MRFYALIVECHALSVCPFSSLWEDALSIAGPNGVAGYRDCVNWIYRGEPHFLVQPAP